MTINFNLLISFHIHVYCFHQVTYFFIKQYLLSPNFCLSVLCLCIQTLSTMSLYSVIKLLYIFITHETFILMCSIHSKGKTQLCNVLFYDFQIFSLVIACKVDFCDFFQLGYRVSIGCILLIAISSMSLRILKRKRK